MIQKSIKKNPFFKVNKEKFVGINLNEMKLPVMEKLQSTESKRFVDRNCAIVQHCYQDEIGIKQAANIKFDQPNKSGKESFTLHLVRSNNIGAEVYYFPSLDREKETEESVLKEINKFDLRGEVGRTFIRPFVECIVKFNLLQCSKEL